MNLTKLGRYEIKAFLGRGGMATVYRAFDPSFGRDVAIKVLPSDLVDDPDFRVRFEREARIIAGLEHSAIVPVYDFGHENDQPYIVMRLMLGGSLADQLNHGPIPLGKTVDILSRLALALDRAHERSIIHRDLKPANFLLDTGWTRYAIETRLPERDKWLNYGILLAGRCILWADSFRSMVRGAKGDWVDLERESVSRL